MIKEKFYPAQLIGEYEFIIGTNGNDDFVSSEEMLLMPGFNECRHKFAKALNRCKLEGRHIIRFKIMCHAQSEE